MSPISRRIAASPEAVYAALLNPAAVARWRVPYDMTSEVHELQAHEGGAIHVSLSYRDESRAGKTGGHTDTYRGRFVELVPGRRVVEAIEFETADASISGEMLITTTLAELPDGGTEIELAFEGLPPGVRPEDNEQGTRMALDRLASLLEARPTSRPA